MGTTSYASIPYPELPNSPNVPSDTQAVAARMDAILSLALGGGTTIPGTALNLSAVPGQITTLQNTQNTQATTLNTLNTRPYVQQAYIAQPTVFQWVLGNKFTDQTVQTLSIPSQTYTRLLVCYATSCWGWSTSMVNSLRSRLKYNGAERVQTIQSGLNQTLNLFFMQTVAAGVTSTITQTISVYTTASSSTQAETQEFEPLIYALLLPWFGSTLTHP